MIQIKAIMAFRTHYEEPAYSCLSLSVHRGWQGTSEPLSVVNKIIQEELNMEKYTRYGNGSGGEIVRSYWLLGTKSYSERLERVHGVEVQGREAKKASREE